MLNQSFSAENLRSIYEYENRRGKGLDKRFFPVLQAINQELTAKGKQLRAVRRANPDMPKEQLEALVQPHREEIRKIRDRREVELQSEMARLGISIASRGFRFHLAKSRVLEARRCIRQATQLRPTSFRGSCNGSSLTYTM